MQLPEETVDQFAAFVHARCPDEPNTLVLRHELERDRGLCGDHGRVVPTRQNLCPKCGGRIEMVDERRAELIRKLWRELQPVADDAPVRRLKACHG